VIPLGYGEFRIAGNLFYARWFVAIPHSGGPSSSKGGGRSVFVQYTYVVSALLGLCEGPMAADAAVPCTYPQQFSALGRATPGRQVLTISDKTGAEAKPQDEDGWSPAVWKTKKVRRVVNDQGKSPIKGDPDGELADDGDDKDTKKGFRPTRFHNWDEIPDGNTPETGRPSFLTNPIGTVAGPATGGVARVVYNYIRGAWKNVQSLRPGGPFQRQRDLYVAETNENYIGITCVGRQNMQLGSNASLPNWNFPVRGLQQYRDIYAAATLTVAATASATTLTVASTAMLPTSGEVLLDGEIITYSGKTSTTLTDCTRGTSDTTAATHAIGAKAYDTTSAVQIFDADPACILLDLLTNPKHGAGWDRAPFTTLLQGYPTPWGARLHDSELDAADMRDSWSAYCRANQILISPLWDSQRSLADILGDLADITNTAIVWSEGRLKMIPYGDVEVVSTGAVGERFTSVTFTPTDDPGATTDGANIGVRYDLTLDEFLPGKGGDAVLIARRPIVPDVRGDYKSDGFFNHVRAEFLNAANGYAVEIVEAKDDASIAEVGLVAQEPDTRHEFTNAQAAQDYAERRLARLVVVRNVYSFKLDWRFVLLEPMDVVTLTDPSVGLNQRRVRITAIDEDKEGALSFEAEDYPGDFAGGVSPVEPENPTILDESGVVGGGFFSPSPVDGAYGDGLPVGAPQGVIYASLDPTQEFQYLRPEEVATPMPVDVELTALAVRAYQVVTFAPLDTQPYGMRWRVVTIQPGGLVTSHPELEVRFDRSEIQWLFDTSVQQATVSSKRSTGSLLVAAGTLVCLEITACDAQGVPLVIGGVQAAAASFTSTLAWGTA
jgi:hypothetical protein